MHLSIKNQLILILIVMVNIITNYVISTLVQILKSLRKADVRYELTENAEAKHTPLRKAKPEITFKRESFFQ